MPSTTVARFRSTGCTDRCLTLLLVCFAACCSAPASVAEEAEAFEVIRAIPYASGDPTDRSFDIVRPRTEETTAGVLLLLSEDMYSSWLPIAYVHERVRPLVEVGLTVFLIPHEPTVPCSAETLVRDVGRAVKHIRHNAARFRVDPDRLGVMGSGISGHLALLLATVSDDASGGDRADSASPESASSFTEAFAAVVVLQPARLKRRGAQAEASDGVARSEDRSGDHRRIPAVMPEAASSAAILQIVERLGDRSGGWQDGSVQQALRRAGITNEVIEIDVRPHSGEAVSDAEAELRKWFRAHLDR